MLNMLRLKQHHPRVFKQFLTRYRDVSEAQAGYELFRRCFPKYEGMNPLYRPNVRFYGYPDDAQIMDEALFAELKDGFNDYVSFAISRNSGDIISFIIVDLPEICNMSPDYPNSNLMTFLLIKTKI